MRSLADALGAGTVILDGGLSTELEARGSDVSSALWSARLLRDDPAAIVAAHAAFAAAGAQVATTASYQATVDGFGAAGVAAAEAFAMAAEVDAIIAVGINCTDPAGLTAAIALASTSGKPVVAYPNSGEGWDAVGRGWTGSPEITPDDVRSWVEAGARLIGGCCRVRPAHIATLTRMIR